MIAKPNFEGFEVVQLSSTHVLETITPFYLRHELHNSINNHQSFNMETTTPQKMHPKIVPHHSIRIVKSESCLFHNKQETKMPQKDNFSLHIISNYKSFVMFNFRRLIMLLHQCRVSSTLPFHHTCNISHTN